MNGRPCTASDAARYMVNFCIDEDEPISNLQLQKILYFCQVESYRKNDEPLFEDDFEAWRYGPVIPSVYRLFSIFGGLKISRKVLDGNHIPQTAKMLIEEVSRNLRTLYPWELVDKTHSSGSPWAKTYENGRGNGRIIDKKLIAADAQGA